MTTLTMPELTEVEGKLKKLQKDLGVIFAEATSAEGALDLSKVKSIDGDTTAKAAHIKSLNDEMTDLGKRREDLKSILAFAGAADADHEESEDTARREAKSKGSWLDQVVKSGALSSENKGTQFDLAGLDVKAVFSTAAGWAPPIVRDPLMIESAQRRPLGIIDLIPTEDTSVPSSSYMEETTFTNAAVETGEGVTKPEATLVLTERTWTARKIPVILPVTDEQLEDVLGIEAYVRNRLPFMVRQRLSSQVIVGNGTPPNLRGVLNVAGILTQARGTDPGPDAIYKAMVRVMTTGQAFPSGVAFNPVNWQEIRLLRTVDGIYIWGSPSEAGPERIWGLNVALDQALTANTAVVADWSLTALKVRQGMTVEVGFNADDWAKNQQTFRAEMRAAFVVYRPAAVCTVTGML